MARSAHISFGTTPELRLRLRRLAFLRGWTVSRTAHEALSRGLPALEEEISEADRAAWEALFSDGGGEGD
jgi:hypothetical protein